MNFVNNENKRWSQLLKSEKWMGGVCHSDAADNDAAADAANSYQSLILAYIFVNHSTML